MTLKTVQQHEAKPLTSSQVATLQVPTGGKIHSIFLYFTTSAGAAVTEAQIRAEIGNVRLTINGKDVVNVTATQLLDLYEVLGTKVGTAAGIAAVVELNVGALLYTDPAARELFGFGTANVNSVQVQVTAGTLSAIANVAVFTQRTAENENLGAFTKFFAYPQSFNATGQHSVDTLPRNPDTAYLLVMADDGASGTITVGECKLNNASIMDPTPSAVNSQRLSNAGYVQPSGYFVYAFADSNLNSVLPMKGANDFRLLTTFSVAPGAASYTLCALTLENIG